MRRPSGSRPRNPWKPGRFLSKTAHLKPRTVRMEGAARRNRPESAVEPLPPRMLRPEPSAETARRRAGLQSPVGERIAPVRRKAPVGMPVTGPVAHRRSGCTSLAGSRIAGRAAPEELHRQLRRRQAVSLQRAAEPAGAADLCCQPGYLTGRSARPTGPQKAAESRSQPARRMNRPVLSAGLHPSAALHRPGEGRVGWPPRSRTGICPASGFGTDIRFGIRPASGAAPATPSDTTVKPCSLWRHDPRYT